MSIFTCRSFAKCVFLHYFKTNYCKNMNAYKEIKETKAKVLRVDEEEHKFIVEVENKIYKVAQIAFQRRQPMPDTLDCLMATNSMGKIIVSQNIEALMRRRYNESDEVDFKIKFTLGENYQMEDEYGFTAMLKRDSNINPALTPLVRCRITKFRSRYMETALVEVQGADKSEFSLTEKDFADIIGAQQWNNQNFHALMLGDTTKDLFDIECHRWITNIATNLSQEKLQLRLEQIRTICLDTLQGPRLLPGCKEAERTLLEQRFTDMIELLSYYIQAIDILKQGKAEENIQQMLHTLASCAYIYHPRKQFCIMQCIYMLDFPLMEKHIGDILATLRSQEPYLWGRKPFQLQWIKLLQTYVENIYMQTDRLSSDPATKENMILVLVAELILGRHANHKIYDLSLNQALLYRLVSGMNVSDPNKTLQRSFLALFTHTDFDPALPFNGDDAFILANMLCSQENNEQPESFDNAKYEGEQTILSITEQTISIQPKNLDRENLYLPLSSRMGLWHGLSVKLDEKPPLNLRGKIGTTIEHYKELWQYINLSLFSPKRKASQVRKRKLDIDDETDIIVTRQLEGQLLFECRIVEEGIEGTGTLNCVNDVVLFYPGEISIHSFEYQGMPLLLRAYVKDINTDGSYVFAMKEMVTEYMDDVRVNDLFYSSRLTCLLNNHNDVIGRVPAVSSEGFSVSVEPGCDMTVDDLKKGMIVEVGNISQGTNGYLNGTFVRESPESRFCVSEAFHQLMLGYANRETYNPHKEIDELEDVCTLDKAYVTELMAIIDTKATLEEDNIKSYNYLNFCRLLAIITDSKERTAYYNNRLALLEILNDFAVFDKVDTTKIERVSQTDPELFERNAMLRHDFMQLRIIGCLDSEEHYEELYAWSSRNEDPQLQQLASLVLSHNFVKKSGLLSQAGDILDKIRALLKLHKSSSNKKNYGKEDFHTEFKTSIIYPENSMKVDVETQTVKIMQEICAFLNAEGGHLYLGVSDIGYEMGLEEDLKNPLFKGSRDKYEVYVNNKIVYYLGQEGAHYVRTHFDTEVSNAVLIIDIEPCPHPIAVGCEYFERMGTSARKVHDNYTEKFLAIRKQWAEEHTPQLTLATGDAAHGDTTAPSLSANTAADRSKAKSVVNPAPIKDSIQTSRVRNNALHEYEEGYRPLSAVVCLMGTNEYKVLDEDDWADYRLKLAVHENEEQGWLILVYESGKVCKVSMTELLQRERGRVFKRYDGEKLIYASIATDDDSVCVGFTDGKGNRYVRFDDVDRFAHTKMQADGTLPMDVPHSGVHYVEILPISQVPIMRNVNRKTIGTILKTKEGRHCIETLPGLK